MTALARLRFLPPEPGDDGRAAAPGGEGALAVYEAACRAVAEARTAGEAKEIADKAEAMRVYARQANNRGLEVDAAEIRIRAERRLGEIIATQKAGGDFGRGRPEKPASQEGFSAAPTLRDVGVDYKLSARAQQLAALPPWQFDEHLSGWRSAAEREGSRITTRILRRDDKKAMRAERERTLGAKQLALPEKLYGVILADPEWRHEPWSRATGLDRAADNHYPTSPTEVIAARPVASISAPDSVLWMWGTVPMLPQALEVMARWGWIYRSHLVWRKVYPGGRLGPGYWSRIDHELLLIGTRGRVPAPALGGQWPHSVIDAPWTGEHSEKPAIFHEIIEHYFPTLPKIELNARRARPGWDLWGYEAPDAEAAA